MLGPLILLSFVSSSFTADLSNQVLETVGVEWQGPGFVLPVLALVFALVVNFFIVYLLLGNLGGIRPPRRARVIGSGVGAVVIEVLKVLMSLLISFTIDKPQYGAIAAPIGILFVLFLLTMALYASAALTAGIADKDVPLELLEPDSIDDAQASIEDATGEITAISDDERTRA